MANELIEYPDVNELIPSQQLERLLLRLLSDFKINPYVACGVKKVEQQALL